MELRNRRMQRRGKRERRSPGGKAGEGGPMRKEIPLKVTLIMIPVAAAMVVFGLLRGEAAAILSKAITICMECIGLG